MRQLTLNEDFDAFGRLIQLQGTNIPLVSAKAGFGRDYLAAATEVTTKDALEVWQIANLTGDTHPIHFHLVNVQILSRQPFSSHYSGVPHLKGDPVPPAPEEAGWKETVRMHPGEVTTVIMQFKLPRVPVDIPTTPRDAANGSDPGLGLTLPPGAVANEYVWHCHILEHEEHDMMRPLVVIGQAPLGVAPTPQTITRATGGTATFHLGGGVRPYTIASSDPVNYPPTEVIVGGNVVGFTVPVIAGATSAAVTFTITDSSNPCDSVTAVLNIV